MAVKQLARGVNRGGVMLGAGVSSLSSGAALSSISSGGAWLSLSTGSGKSQMAGRIVGGVIGNLSWGTMAGSRIKVSDMDTPSPEAAEDQELADEQDQESVDVGESSDAVGGVVAGRVKDGDVFVERWRRARPAPQATERRKEDLFREHRRLALRKVRNELSALDELRLRLVRWKLDRIEEAETGPARLSLEAFAAEAERFAELVEQATKGLPEPRARRSAQSKRRDY